jgi:hypothetical protein
MITNFSSSAVVSVTEKRSSDVLVSVSVGTESQVSVGTENGVSVHESFTTYDNI